MKTGELATRLGISVQTVRDYASRYEEYMSPGANPEKGAIREYTEQDARIMATIRRESDRRLSVDEIKQILDTGQLVDHVPEAPPKEESVPAEEHQLAIERINILTVEITRLQTARERDRDRIAELEREAGQLKTERDMAIRLLRKRAPELAEELFPEDQADG